MKAISILHFRNTILAACTLLLLQAASYAAHVSEFGALPNDSIDDAVAIQRAIDAALERGETSVEFDKGEYLVSKISGVSPYNDRKTCIMVDGAKNGFSLRGALNEKGEPATCLIYDEPGPRFEVDYWMWISRSRDVTIENLIIDFPGAAASGRIEKIEDGKTWVKAWPNTVLPETFLKGAEYVFLYDPENGNILEPKVTLGNDWDEIRRVIADEFPEREDPYASVIDHETFVIDHELGEVGMGLSFPVQWHHAPEKTFVANQVENLRLRNITTVMGLGHLFLPVGCKNITVENFILDPGARGANRGWVARRDALTLRACRGELLVEDSLFQATSDDQLAFWGFHFEIVDIESPTKITIATPQEVGDYFLDFPLWIEQGDWLEFRQKGPDGRYALTGDRSYVKAAEFEIDRDARMDWKRHFEEEIEKEAYQVRYKIELEAPLPEWIHDDPRKLFLLGSTVFDKVTLRRVTTRNVTNHPGVLIAGALNYLIEDCHFGTAVRVQSSDGSRGWHGGSGIINATIRNNTFTSSPILPDRKGLETNSVITPENRGTIRIENNLFLDNTPLELAGTQRFVIRGNTFHTSDGNLPIQTGNRFSTPPVTIRDNVIVAPASDGE